MLSEFVYLSLLLIILIVLINELPSTRTSKTTWKTHPRHEQWGLVLFLVRWINSSSKKFLASFLEKLNLVEVLLSTFPILRGPTFSATSWCTWNKGCALTYDLLKLPSTSDGWAAILDAVGENNLEITFMGWERRTQGIHLTGFFTLWYTHALITRSHAADGSGRYCM